MTTTGLVVTIFIISLAIYDLVVVLYTGVGTSVSRFLQRSALKSPWVCFGIAFICGHLFGYMAPECPPCANDQGREEYKIPENGGCNIFEQWFTSCGSPTRTKIDSLD